jgi:glutamate synthase domain-containing protein 1
LNIQIDDYSHITYNERKIMKSLTADSSEHNNKQDAIAHMEREYETEFPESMKKETVNVCNWNEVFEERGIIKGTEQTKLDNALRMIADGELTLKKIASYTNLPLEKIQELAVGKSA